MFALVLALAVPIILGLFMPGFPIAGVVVFGLVTFIASVGVRLAAVPRPAVGPAPWQQKHRVVIYGAGATGVQLVAALRSHERIVPVAFVDDNAALHSTTVSGLRVLPPTGWRFWPSNMTLTG